MKTYIIILASAFLLLTGCQRAGLPEGSLMVSENNRYLTLPDGSPFLWIGDTAWELFHRLNREEAVEYLENRVDKGITVIQAVVLAENDGLRTPNAYGALPFEELDPTRPVEAYFEHVDFIVNKAEELGLFIGMLPTWGDKIFSEHPGSGPIVFNPENAQIFGEFLGKRYKDKPVIWILGGDRNIANMEVLDTWRAMAAGLKSGDGGRNLISYHPRGASMSSHWLHNETWLDFNMYQSGHSRHYTPVYNYAEHLALLHPVKPFVEAEPAYEDIAVEFWNYFDLKKATSRSDTVSPIDVDGLIQDPSVFAQGFFTDADVRVHGYWNFLSGACGYTYGNNAIWQMWKKGMPYAIPCLTDWKEALDRPGSEDLRHINKLMRARAFHLLVPDQSIIFGPVPDGKEHIRAAIAANNSFMLVYLSVGQKVKVNMHKLNNQVMASWYDTREGTVTKIGEYDNTGIVEFVPPTSGRGEDWMLVLDDRTRELPAL
ncbi:MAG: glycoside hydrolase family 140 protein [Bacteroidales bacterium]